MKRIGTLGRTVRTEPVAPGSQCKSPDHSKPDRGAYVILLRRSGGETNKVKLLVG